MGLYINLPSIDFDDAVFPGCWVQGILDVTFTDDAKMSDDLECSASQHVVFVIRECLGWGDDDRIASMCAKGIKVFHVTTDDGVLKGESGVNKSY